MMITLAGAPCSGKSTVAKTFALKYNFENISTGKLIRKMAEDMGLDIIQMQTVLNNDKSIDAKIEDMQKEMGKSRINDNLLLDSRLGWYCVPESFKVYVTIPEMEMARRFLQDNERENDQKVETVEEALDCLNYRRNQEIERFKKTYGVDLSDTNNYDLIVENYGKTPEETADEIYRAYKEFITKKGE